MMITILVELYKLQTSGCDKNFGANITLNVLLGNYLRMVIRGANTIFWQVSELPSST